MELDGYDDTTCLVSARNAMERIAAREEPQREEIETPVEDVVDMKYGR